MKGKNLEGAIANTSHPRYAAPGESEGESWRRRSEWISPAAKQRLVDRAKSPQAVRVGLQAAIEQDGKS